jgi:thiamine biosynthesis lipoprotein
LSQASAGITVVPGTGCWIGKFIAMASPCEILCETRDPSIADQLTWIAASEAWRIENKFSRYRDDNIVHTINSAQGTPVCVDPETALLLDFAQTLYELSERRFDITSGILRHAWKFDGSDNLPQPSIVEELLQRVGWHRVHWQSPQVTMPAGMEIDLGGIGKEYAVDRATALLREQTDISCVVNFGGDLAVSRAPFSRQSWHVGIEMPDEAGSAERLIEISTGALATSGDARRYLEKDGIRYSHILDPLTGWPVPDAPRSVTVAAETCTSAGMLSTLAMLKGSQCQQFLAGQGVRYWCSHPFLPTHKPVPELSQ